MEDTNEPLLCKRADKQGEICRVDFSTPRQFTEWNPIEVRRVEVEPDHLIQYVLALGLVGHCRQEPTV